MFRGMNPGELMANDTPPVFDWRPPTPTTDHPLIPRETVIGQNLGTSSVGAQGVARNKQVMFGTTFLSLLKATRIYRIETISRRADAVTGHAALTSFKRTDSLLALID